MKNYEETIETVFGRIGQYKAEQKRRKRIILRTVTPLCCLCLVGAAAFGIWWENQPDNVPEQTLEDALYPGVKDTFDISKGESPDDPAANNKIIVNSIDEAPAGRMDTGRMNIALMWDDFIEMSQAKINDYYGINVLPEIPDDMKAWEGEGGVFGIFRRDNGTGDVYWDQNIYNFSNEDVTRYIHMTVAKGRSPFFCVVIEMPETAKSIINNHEIAIMQYEDGSYHVEFMYQNVGFYISAQGITQDELVSVISSIIK